MTVGTARAHNKIIFLSPKPRTILIYYKLKHCTFVFCNDHHVLCTFTDNDVGKTQIFDF